MLRCDQNVLYTVDNDSSGFIFIASEKEVFSLVYFWSYCN